LARGTARGIHSPIRKLQVSGGKADSISVQLNALYSQRRWRQPTMEPSMDSFYRILLASLLTVRFISSACAQDGQPGPQNPQAALPAELPPMLTGKERLGRKWTDEQRIDNCNVPIDKRGTKPRPSTCAAAQTGS
jgi:hypothetical protein